MASHTTGDEHEAAFDRRFQVARTAVARLPAELDRIELDHADFARQAEEAQQARKEKGEG